MSASKTLTCAVCGVELTTADADDAVKTDAGPVHRECFDGPVPPPDHADDLLADACFVAEEEEARREAGDPPLPDHLRDDDGATDCFECHAEPSINGGLGFLCRGRSML